MSIGPSVCLDFRCFAANERVRGKRGLTYLWDPTLCSFVVNVAHHTMCMDARSLWLSLEMLERVCLRSLLELLRSALGRCLNTINSSVDAV